MVPLFAATLVLSGTLLFIAEPMIGKLILPLLGGTPAVWNTCVMFFQFELLAGYLYAHMITTRLRARTQIALQLGLLAVGLTALPLAVRGEATMALQRPIVTVLALLTRSIGLPLLAIAGTAPLLQRWLASTRDPAARDPFFLYAASNLGSLLALVAYPFLIEPTLRLTTQRWAWSAGYSMLLVLTAACAWLAQSSPQPIPGAASKGEPYVDDGSDPDVSRRPTLWRRARWLALTFVPSSLMLSVTTYISTDIAAVPLLWVAPLALYLLTYVLAFARRPIVSSLWMNRLLPFALVVATYFVVAGPAGPLWRMLVVPLATLFIVALACHGSLAADRPSTRNLTEYYLWISVGGLVGGVFNTLVAPAIFTSTAEYPLGLVLAALLLPRASSSSKPRGVRRYIGDVALPVLIGAVVFVLPSSLKLPFLSTIVGGLLVVVGLPLIAALSLSRNPVRFGLALGAIVLGGMLRQDMAEPASYVERTFFGTHKVVNRSTYRVLIHGTTTHGAQSRDPARRCDPLSYYHRTGPAGQLFDSFAGEFTKFNVASIGLGAATMTAYAQPFQQWTLFEINPAVVRIAGDPRYFTYLRDCVQRYHVVTGDARIELAREADERFDVMIFDAFSSDAIPVHLATREALGLYLRKLAPRGVLAFHISNRYLDLGPVLGDLAHDAGLSAMIEYDFKLSPAERTAGKLASLWVVMARRSEDFGDLPRDRRWTRLEASGHAVWTDDYSNIVAALKVVPR